jgi:hypothetical protein
LRPQVDSIASTVNNLLANVSNSNLDSSCKDTILQNLNITNLLVNDLQANLLVYNISYSQTALDGLNAILGEINTAIEACRAVTTTTTTTSTTTTG